MTRLILLHRHLMNKESADVGYNHHNQRRLLIDLAVYFFEFGYNAFEMKY